MYTGGPAPRVRALLELCRPAVDEIFVAIDETGDPHTLGACAGLADKTFRLGPCIIEELIGWLMLECAGDWTLRLDSDEIPSPELLRELRQLVQDPFPICYQLPRRWLYPDTRHYIATPPWRPDFQVRLVRNLPGLWRIPGIPHSSVEMPGDHRLTDLPVYHADLVVNPVEKRAMKAAEYESRGAGHTWDGTPVNHMYLPEHHDPEVAPVPADAVPSIERVLAGAKLPRRRGRPNRSPRFSGAGTRVLAGNRPVDAAELHAEIAWADPPSRLEAGSTTNHLLIATNRGTEWWPRAEGPPEIRIGYRFVDRLSGATTFEGRAIFTENVRPNQTTRLMAQITAPEEPGEYVLEVGLVLERVEWFDVNRVTVELIP